MKVKVCFILLITIIYPYIKGFALEIPLTVTDYAGIERKSEPVTSGIPLPESAQIKNPYNFALYNDKRNQVPAQFDVLARWGGKPDDSSKPIKWILLDFQANTTPNESSIYYLRDNGSGNPPINNLAVDEDMNHIYIDTGKIKFSVSKKYFDLFDLIEANGENFVEPANESGITIGDSTVTKIISGKEKGSHFIKVISTSGYAVGDKFQVLGSGEEKTITKIKGNIIHFRPPLKTTTDKALFIRKIPESITEYYSYLDKPELAVEEKGPLKIVIKVQGALKSKNGAYLGQLNDYDKRLKQPYPWVNYTCRIFAYDKKDYIRIILTFENNGCHAHWPEKKFSSPQWLYFEELSLNLKLNMQGSVKISTDGYAETYNQGSDFTLYQDCVDNEFICNVSKENKKIENGKAINGWVDVNDGKKGVTVAVRHFWQNYPKAIVFSDNTLTVGLWPKEGFYPENTAGEITGVYQFEGGRHKTYELIYRFYNNADNEGEIINLSKILNSPLFVLAPLRWYCESGALGIIGPSDLSSENEETEWALKLFEKIQRSKVYSKDSDSDTIYDVRGKDKKGYYGWMNFGDLKWSDGYCSLHYDWPHSMLLHFIRTGKRNFFDMGVEMTRHRYDIDQHHGEREDVAGNEHTWSNYLQRYEKGFHGEKNEWIPKLSHTWNGGLTLYYLLTGDRKSLEAAEEVGKAVMNYKWLAENPEKEARFEGWAILNLINLWQINNDDSLLDLAHRIALGLVNLEKQSGGKGYIEWEKGNTYTYSQFCLIIEPLIYAHYYTHDEEILNLLKRMNKWLKEEALYGGKGFYEVKWDYMPLQMPYQWFEGRKNEGGVIVYDYFTANLPAYLYLQTGNREDLNLARHLFEDSIFYWQKTGSKLCDKADISKVTYTPSQFPGSNTKIHGWTGKAHQIYLYAEWQALKKIDEKEKR